MILNLDNLHFYLLENGTLQSDTLVRGGYSASQARTRNTTFNVNCRDGKNLFIKQLVSFDGPNSYLLQKDATCLWLIKNETAFQKLSTYVPHYYGYDASNQVLITELLPEARNMEVFFRVEQADIIPYSGVFADILNSFHFPLSASLQNLPSMRFFQKQLPWVFNLGVPNTGSQPDGSPVMYTVTHNPDFQAMLKDARDRYEYTSLIHGDIKWMNFLITGKGPEEKIYLIDWEIADIGDPMWDVAGYFMSVLLMEIAESPYQPRDMSHFPTQDPIHALAPCWPRMQRFWQEYTRRQAAYLPDPAASLDKALHFAGARLIQTAIEYNMHSNQMNPNANRMLQTCIALFAHRNYIREQLALPATLSLR